MKENPEFKKGEPATRTQFAYSDVTPVISFVVITLGLLTFVGWAAHVEALIRISPNSPTMKPIVALAFILCGSSLLLKDPRFSRLGGKSGSRLLDLCVILIGSILIVEHLSGWDLWIDHLFFAQRWADAIDGLSGFAAPHTAFNFIIIGSALLATGGTKYRGRRAAEFLAVVVFFLSIPFLIGHSFQSDFFIGMSMAPLTAAIFILLALGLLFLWPQSTLISGVLEEGPGGSIARRLLPAAVLVPLGLSWLVLLGERGGWYDANFSLAIFAAAVILIFTLLVLANAAMLSRADTEKARAIQALKESEDRYRELFKNSPQPMWVFDLESLAFLDINETAVKHYGFSRSEFLSMTIKDIRPDEDVGLILENLSLGRDNPRKKVIWRHRKKDGSSIDAEVHSHHFEYQGRQASLVVINDITERQRAEERFRAVAETANDAIISASSRGEITYFNRQAESVFGYKFSEAVNQPLTLLIPEKFQAPHLSGFARYLETKVPRVVGRTVQLVGRRNDGHEFPMELSLASYDVAGETCFTAIIRDITERVRTEAELRQAKEAAEATNKELEAFAYSVSHDLRAPLRSIDGFSQALLQDCAGQLDSTGRGYLDRVCRATSHMATLIDDLLNLSRVTRSEMHREPVDLSDTARSIAEELQRRDLNRKVRFEIADGLTVTGDPRLLRVLLQNLLENAWKFTAKHECALICVGVESNNGATPTYFVRDDGAGFDMAYAAKLFGAFQRLHTVGEFPGTGIGLATVQRIAHRHGGTAWAEGAIEKGATVYFNLG